MKYQNKFTLIELLIVIDHRNSGGHAAAGVEQIKRSGKENAMHQYTQAVSVGRTVLCRRLRWLVGSGAGTGLWQAVVQNSRIRQLSRNQTQQ